jgi:hypothetical protein
MLDSLYVKGVNISNKLNVKEYIFIAFGLFCMPEHGKRFCCLIKSQAVALPVSAHWFIMQPAFPFR